MIDFLKRLFGGGGKPTPAPVPNLVPAPQPTLAREQLPPLPQDKIDAFLDWYRAQRKPAVRFTPVPDAPIEPLGSRLLGPAYLLDGEQWPRDDSGEPLQFLAQINFADCASLDGYPRDGVIQFFIGIDDLFGADFDNLLGGQRLVRVIPADAKGALRNRPPISRDDEYLYTPSQSDAVRERGMMLVAIPFEDRMDLSNKEADQRFFAMSDEHDLDPLYEAVDEIDQTRDLCHHTGGFPAFTQSDIRHDAAYEDFDHVLLRLTSDDILMWGDAGECVFMMRSDDLARGDFDKVAYSWDCS